ncbi:MAG TPA: response regulator [Prolixibacteraceae bacterium]|nr:response regulator [Prolixibacteraceae bacterium]
MKKILAIDDNWSNLKYLSAIFAADFPGFQVFISQSGDEGIEIAKSQLPDTILLDILMPEMDGFTVCHILKSNPLTKHIPIVFLSALNELDYRIKGLNLGADAFISKPFNRVELKAQVNVMLRIKQAEDMLRNRNRNLEIFINKQTAEFISIEDRYLKISEYALEYFWEVDQDGTFNYVSAGIIKILGFNPKEIVGQKSLFDFYIHDEDMEYKNLIKDIFTKRENYTGNEFPCHHRNGEKVWLTISGLPLYDDNNEFSGYVGVNHDITRQKLAEEANLGHQEKIDEYQKKLKNLYFELTIAEEKERRKIAEYLHDGLGQTISIAAIKLSSISRGDLPLRINKILGESVELLRNAINESRMLVYDLSPPILYELGLIPAIKWKLEQIKKKYNIPTAFKSEENSINLDTDIETLIFRIVCELLNNSLKHAEASYINVEIIKNLNNLTVVVSDNGKGFVFTQEKNLTELHGFGLFSIKEKLDSLHGSLEIDSEISHGARIVITVPI